MANTFFLGVLCLLSARAFDRRRDFLLIAVFALLMVSPFRRAAGQTAQEKAELESKIEECKRLGTGQSVEQEALYVKKLTETLKLAERLNDKQKTLFCLYLLALVYEKHKDDLNKAEKMALRCEELAKQVNNRQRLGLTYNLLASIYEKQNQYDRALVRANQAVEWFDKLRKESDKGNLNTRLYAVSIRTRARVYNRLNRADNAETDLHAALKLLQKPAIEVDDTTDLNDIYLELTRLLIDNKQYGRALAVLDQWKPLLRPDFEFANRYWHEARGRALQNLGRGAEAAEAWENAHRLQGQSAEKEKMQLISEARARLEVYQADAENRYLAAQNEKKNAYLVVLALGVVALAALLGIAVYKRRLSHTRDEQKNLKLKAKLALSEAKTAQLAAEQLKIEMQARFDEEENSRRLAEAALEKQKIENENMKLTREATALSHRLLERKSTFQMMIQKVDELIDEKPNLRLGGLRQLKNSLRAQLNDDESWLEYKHYFDQVYVNFIEKLQTNYDLTQQDVRLAVYIKLNLPNHEIGELLNIQPDSLKNARARLRKKFNLQKGDSLDGFLQSYGAPRQL